MKYNRSFFIIIYFLIAAACHAMEIENKPSIFKEITAVKNPWRVQYLAQDRVVIAGEMGCSIVNPITNEVIKKLNNFNYQDRSKSSNINVCHEKKKIISFHDTLLEKYDAQTGEKECRIQKEQSISFLVCHPWLENTIFLSSGNRKKITKYNFFTNDAEDISIDWYGCDKIVLHPKKEIICFLDTISSAIATYTSDDLTLKSQIYLSGGGFFQCQYSPDGSCIIVVSPTRIAIIHPEENNKPLYLHYWGNCFNGIAVHPNSSILATVSREKTEVCYWDIKTLESIDTTQLSLKDAHDIAFSDNGFESIVALDEKCLAIPVSFKVSWHNKYLYFLFLLKNYLNQHHDEMPEEIAGYAMKIAYQI